MRGIEGKRAPRVAHFVGNHGDETPSVANGTSPLVQDAYEVDVVLQIMTGDQAVDATVADGEAITFSGDVGHASLSAHVADPPELPSRDQVDADELGRGLSVATSHFHHAARNHLAQHGEALGMLVVGEWPEAWAAAEQASDSGEEVSRCHRVR